MTSPKPKTLSMREWQLTLKRRIARFLDLMDLGAPGSVLDLQMEGISEAHNALRSMTS